jgi:hypothetical protein
LDHILQGIGNQLSYLKLTKITSQVAHRWITFCPNLTHLHIESLRNTRILTYTNDWFCPLVEKGILKVEKLTYLSLMCCNLGEQEANQIATLKNLSYLNLWGNHLLAEDENALITPKRIPSKKQSNQEAFQFHLTQLTYLNLSYTCEYAGPIDPSLSFIVPRLGLFQELTELSYNGVTFLNSDFRTFINSLKTLPHLQKLSLADSGITDSRAQQIANNLPNLTSLSVCSNFHITLAGVTTILTSLKQLTEIDISFTQVGDQEEFPQVIDALLEHHHDFSRFIYYVNFETKTQQQREMFETQRGRLLDKFPNCDVDFDHAMILGIR